MVYLFCLLFVITSAFAQPVMGPYNVTWLDFGMSFKSVAVGTRGNYVDIFYFADSVLYAAEFSIESQTITRVPHALRAFPDVTRLEIYDPLALDENRWGVLVYEGSGVGVNKTYLLHGNHDSFSETAFDSGYANFNFPVSGDNWNETFSLTPRADGGAMAGWIEGVFYQFDPNFGPMFCMLSGEGEIDSVYDLGQNELWNPGWNRPVFRSISHDIVVGSWGATNDNEVYLWGNDPDGINEYHETQACNVESLMDFGRTASGDLLAAFREYSAPPLPYMVRYVFDEFGNVTCADGYEPTMVGDPMAACWHPNFGFAVLSFYDHSMDGMGLARVDTSLTEVQPPGMFYEGENIQSYDLAISDSGDVFMLWTERTPSETDLRLAYVGWDVFLDVDTDSRSTPVPSSMILSSYPNPFNSTVSLKYELSQAGEVKLAIYNLAGQEVAQLVNERQYTGQYAVDWTPQGASGIYFAKLHAGQTDCISKLVYIR